MSHAPCADGAVSRASAPDSRGASRSRYYGAGRDLGRLITTHLFCIVQGHSGSTFLQAALATCRATWNLRGEGRDALGYVGPVVGRGRLRGAIKFWAARPRWRAALADPAACDWARTRRAWYFQAFAGDPRASVFVEKSPPHLLVVDALARHFPGAKFLFMVRDPYAVCEGICRASERVGLAPAGGSLPELAARHTVACLERQRRNVEAHRGRGVFFTYEEMCAEPERTASAVRALVPELDDLVLRRRLPVKGRYDEVLTDMNARQIARLAPARVAAFNRVFRAHRGLLGHFGYEMMGEGGEPPGRCPRGARPGRAHLSHGPGHEGFRAGGFAAPVERMSEQS